MTQRKEQKREKEAHEKSHFWDVGDPGAAEWHG